MSRHATTEQHGARVAEEISAATGTHTRTAAARDRAAATEQMAAGGDPAVEMFGALSTQTRLKLELVVRASANAGVALPAAVTIIAGADGAKLDAIVEAINTNDALREQWEQAWTSLRR